MLIAIAIDDDLKGMCLCSSAIPPAVHTAALNTVVLLQTEAEEANTATMHGRCPLCVCRWYGRASNEVEEGEEGGTGGGRAWMTSVR